MNSDQNSGTPQFDKVEYQTAPGSNTCVLCNQPISGSYYRINGEQACANCAERERTAQRDSASNYSRALTFGIGAAIVGLIGYATFEILTGWIIGYLSLGVGWLIAKAMLKGSNGLGGRKYQITAVLLTYFAVSLAAIPVWFSLISKEQKQHQQSQVTTQSPSSNAAPGSTSPDSAANDQGSPAENSGSTTEKPARKMGLGQALGALVLIGLASPFLELSSPFHGLIGLFILFIGLRIAWTMTARPRQIIDGPF